MGYIGSMDNQLLSPINDFVFKKIFGENIPVLTDFLQAVLDLPKEDYKVHPEVDGMDPPPTALIAQPASMCHGRKS